MTKLKNKDMEDKDLLKQNEGSQQGNVHQDADEGRNDEGRQGSTLDKGTQSEQTIAGDDDNNDTRGSDMPSHGGKQEPDTLGNP